MVPTIICERNFSYAFRLSLASTLQHTATHFNTLQRTATVCLCILSFPSKHTDSLPLPPSISLSNMHTRKTHARTYTHTHAHKRTHTPKHTNTYDFSVSLAVLHALSLPLSQFLFCSLSATFFPGLSVALSLLFLHSHTLSHPTPCSPFLCLLTVSKSRNR